MTAGPPRKYNSKMHTNIIAAHQRGLNVEEVCHQVGISKDTYYRWLKEYPKLTDDINRAKTLLIRKSKELLMKAISDGDISTAKWYLERKARSEFASQSNQTIRLTSSLSELSDEELEKIANASRNSK
jgi:transposase-like protein|nr:MAG TPA: putative terminase small subunit [Caudoviricetes sp.]